MAKLKFWLLLLTAFVVSLATAQTHKPVHWTVTFEPADVRAGEVGYVVFNATLEKGWHLYALKNTADATPTSFKVGTGPWVAAGSPSQGKPIVKYDENFMANTAIFEETATFRVPVKLKADAKDAQKGSIDVKFQACNAVTCMRPATESYAVEFKVTPGAARPDHLKAAAVVDDPVTPEATPKASPARPGADVAGNTDEFAKKYKDAVDGGLFGFFVFAFTTGLFALVTPCVFPMIPITVSFFTKGKGAENGKTSYKGAVAYCLGIIGTFTGLGLAMTAIFGATGINRLAANPYVNLGLAALFIVLALSLFGLFEIGLPPALVNKLGTKSRSTGGIGGPLLMGLTFSLTTFTCTVPFVGTLLAGAAKGSYLYPTVGMLGFSLAFALPFFLLALFPQFLAKLPKSGSWLATVKAFMGFLEIAAALKFLSNADLMWQLGILTREVFLALWTTIAVISALYLLGGVKLGHEEGGGKIGWLRRLVGVAMLYAAVVCLQGIQGKPLGDFSAFLPPNPYPGQDLKGVGPFSWESDYDAALAKAKAEGKNVFIDFTGVSCTNCRYMEDNIFPLPKIADRMKQFVLVKLYTDRETPSDQKNAKLQDELGKVSTLPLYVMVGSDGKVIKIHQQQPPISNAEQFESALDAGLKSKITAWR